MRGKLVLPVRMLGAMRARALTILVVVGALTGCSLLHMPYGPAPAECDFPAAAQLVWVGHGDPADFGLIARTGDRPVPGDIYVEGKPLIRRAGDELSPGEAYACVIVPDDDPSGVDAYTFNVPAGWEPP
jgi:hypothetical protein